MEAHELAEKFRNNTKTEESYQNIVKWCAENSKDLDLTDENQYYRKEICKGLFDFLCYIFCFCYLLFS